MIFALCSSHRCHCVCHRESFSQLMAMPEVCNHCIFQGPSPIFSALQSSQDITKTHKQQQNQNTHHKHIYIHSGHRSLCRAHLSPVAINTTFRRGRLGSQEVPRGPRRSPRTENTSKMVRLQWNLMNLGKKSSEYTVHGRFWGSRGRRGPFQAETEFP